MAIFNQGKMVAHGPVYQADTINIGTISGVQDTLALMQQLRLQLEQAAKGGALDAYKSKAAQIQLDEAISVAQSSEPDKNMIHDKLEAAANIIKDTVSVANLFGALTKLAGLVSAIL